MYLASGLALGESSARWLRGGPDRALGAVRRGDGDGRPGRDHRRDVRPRAPEGGARPNSLSGRRSLASVVAARVAAAVLVSVTIETGTLVAPGPTSRPATTRRRTCPAPGFANRSRLSRCHGDLDPFVLRTDPDRDLSCPASGRDERRPIADRIVAGDPPAALEKQVAVVAPHDLRPAVTLVCGVLPVHATGAILLIPRGRRQLVGGKTSGKDVEPGRRARIGPHPRPTATTSRQRGTAPGSMRRLRGLLVGGRLVEGRTQRRRRRHRGCRRKRRALAGRRRRDRGTGWATARAGAGRRASGSARLGLGEGLGLATGLGLGDGLGEGLGDGDGLGLGDGLGDGLGLGDRGRAGLTGWATATGWGWAGSGDGRRAGRSGSGDGDGLGLGLGDGDGLGDGTRRWRRAGARARRRGRAGRRTRRWRRAGARAGRRGRARATGSGSGWRRAGRWRRVGLGEAIGKGRSVTELWRWRLTAKR